MAETAAHLVDHVFPRVPVRQWVFSLPKRLRYFLRHDAELVHQVLRVFLGEVEKALLACTHGAPAGARFGAVSFVHRFGSALNSNLHFHCCVIEGLFGTAGEGLHFTPGPNHRDGHRPRAATHPSAGAAPVWARCAALRGGGGGDAGLPSMGAASP
jgi:hypothetical protein